QGWYFGHNGADWGFQADLIAHKVKGYGVALMTNSDQGAFVMQELRQRVQRAYEWDSLAQPAPRGYDSPLELDEIEVPAEVLDDYVGNYRLDGQVTIEVTLVNGMLLAGPPGQPPAQLFATAMDHFFLRVAPVQILFERDA